MSHDTRRRVIFLLAALLVIALVLGSVGCSSTSGSGDDALSPAIYTEAMSDICTTTTERLDALPTPPEEISRADWAGEVSLALRDEATAFDEIAVGEERRTDHASFVENTEAQAAGWMALRDVLATGEPDADTVGELTTEISELTLGRNDLADEMGITGCQARELS